ncbi:hypothetical protein DL95DRAFT_385178, partial [Leptodontidium sp. 2 PMI_412]
MCFSARWRLPSLIIIPKHEPSGSSSLPWRRSPVHYMRASPSGEFLYIESICHLHMLLLMLSLPWMEGSLLHNILLRVQIP